MKRPRRRRWLILYALLLAASAISQGLIWPGWSADLAPRQSVAVQVDGRTIDLAYQSFGDAAPHRPTIIALHGSPSPRGGGDFRRLAPRLAKHARVIAVDLPGYGQSSKWVGDYGLEANARYVLALMDALRLERADVLGYSFGSGVALEMVRQQPRRVRSLILYGGIGVQEMEGSGDYHFEHFKYALGYALLVPAVELTPHFGLLGRRDMRHAFIRNFTDSDQRPLRGVLDKLNKPLLILHGRRDPLVPARTAYEHHRLVPRSELVMFDDSHFMIFDEAGAAQLADEILPFLARANQPPVRRTLDHTADQPRVEPTLPGGVNLRQAAGPWAQMSAIILGTFMLEDPTSVGVGLLIREGHLDLFVGLLGIFIGIFFGDLGLYALGWFVGRPALRWGPVARRLPVHRVAALGRWFDRHGFSAVLASRFIPGSRFPLYIAAGALGNRPGRFALWTCAAVLIWVAVILAIVFFLGRAATSPFELILGHGWLSLLAAVLLLVVLLHNAPLLLSHVGRGRLIARWSRLWRWEFWPVWLFNAPLVPWLVLLARRHGGFATLTAVNPAIPHSGFIGESKYLILRLLPPEVCVDYALVDPGPITARLAALAGTGLAYPLVLKPDMGQRGEGVKLVRDTAEAQAYFARQTAPVLAQAYHPGPCEAGIFYIRHPHEPRGRIYSITDKHFSVIEGDGRHTLEQLVYGHRRYRMQAELFLARHEEHRDRVLQKGQTLRLAMAGNHCQGTQFRDGSHLLTEALERAIDTIARHHPGLCFGRFDVRYADAEALQAGRGFRVIEFNGVTGESTNVYDPRFTLRRAYRILRGQWRAAFEIGQANRAAGAHAFTTRDLWRMLRAYRALHVRGLGAD